MKALQVATSSLRKHTFSAVQYVLEVQTALAIRGGYVQEIFREYNNRE